MKEMKWEMVGWRKLLNTDDFFLIKYKYGTSVCFWTALSFSNPRLCSFCHLCHLKFLYLYTLTFVCVLFVLFTSYIAFVFLAFFICSLLVSFPSYLFPSGAPAGGLVQLQVASQSAVSQEQVDNILQENDALRTNLAALEQVINVTQHGES